MKPRTKKSIICKDIDLEQYNIDEQKHLYHVPDAGDVAVFEVISIGKHKQIQGANRLNVLILPGDLILGAFGTRYATAQFEGYVPTDCRDIFDILGAGGTIGTIQSMHTTLGGGSTKLKILGYLTDKEGNVANTRRNGKKLIPFSHVNSKETHITLSIGSSMDSGKTTTAGFICRGLEIKGIKSAFIKLTGTVYTKDRDFVYDCGAHVTGDFSDYGFPSTYMCSEQDLLDLFESLLQDVLTYDLEHVVVEIADGILQRETMLLLKNKSFMSRINQVVFSCGDSLSALQGVALLKELDIYPFALSGLFTASPLLIKEVEANTHIPVITIEEWTDNKYRYNNLFNKKELNIAL